MKLVPFLLVLFLLATALPHGIRGEFLFEQSFARNPGTHFGQAIDIDGDWAAVGAPHDAEVVGETQAVGSVTILFRDAATTNWAEMQRLLSDVWMDEFGTDVALDGQWLAVGVPGDNGQATSQSEGEVRLFRRELVGAGSELASVYVSAQNLSKFVDGTDNRKNKLGTALEMDNGVLIAGMPEHLLAAGGVVIFELDGASQTWNEAFYAIGMSKAKIGSNVALAAAGEYAFASGYQYDGQNGIVLAFRRTAAGWAQEQVIAAPESGVQGFGLGLAAHGDILVVGSPYDEGPHPAFDGSARVFMRNSTGQYELVQTIQDTSSDGSYFQAYFVRVRFGVIVVSSFTNSKTSGLVRVYTCVPDSPGTWVERDEFASPEPATNDYFGRDVAFDGEVIMATSFARGTMHVFRDTSIGDVEKCDWTTYPSDGGGDGGGDGGDSSDVVAQPEWHAPCDCLGDGTASITIENQAGKAVSLAWDVAGEECRAVPVE